MPRKQSSGPRGRKSPKTKRRSKRAGGKGMRQTVLANRKMDARAGVVVPHRPDEVKTAHHLRKKYGAGMKESWDFVESLREVSGRGVLRPRPYRPRKKTARKKK